MKRKFDQSHCYNISSIIIEEGGLLCSCTPGVWSKETKELYLILKNFQEKKKGRQTFALSVHKISYVDNRIPIMPNYRATNISHQH